VKFKKVRVLEASKDGTMRTALAAVLIAVLMAMGFLTLAIPTARASVSLVLYGSATGGWGYAPSNMTNPGPTLNFPLGTQLILVLHAQDNTLHNWFIDYDGNNAPSTGEPSTPDFSTSGANTMPALTLDRAGTFTYKCRIHLTAMAGTITIGGTGAPGVNLTLVIGIVVVVVVVAAVVGIILIRRRPKTPPSTPPRT
jgi:plastocyanin